MYVLINVSLLSWDDIDFLIIQGQPRDRLRILTDYIQEQLV